ncbi:hypothetical protein U1Q18_002716 [Sarracenia purpurea var. burkii]
MGQGLHFTITPPLTLSSQPSRIACNSATQCRRLLSPSPTLTLSVSPAIAVTKSTCLSVNGSRLLARSSRLSINDSIFVVARSLVRWPVLPES